MTYFFYKLSKISSSLTHFNINCMRYVASKKNIGQYNDDFYVKVSHVHQGTVLSILF